MGCSVARCPRRAAALRRGPGTKLLCKRSPAHQALYQAYGMPYNKLTSLEYAWRYDLKTGKIAGLNTIKQ